MRARECSNCASRIDHADRNSELGDKIKADREESDYWEKARVRRPTMDEMKARYGNNWGITQPKQRAAKPYVPLSDDDLRRIYGKRHDEPEKGIEF